MEFDIRKAALAAATDSVIAEDRRETVANIRPFTDRVLETAVVYARWLREGVQADEERFLKDLEDMESTGLEFVPQAPVQRLSSRPLTPEEVWGTPTCDHCGHLESVHSLGACYAVPACDCKTDGPVIETAPDGLAPAGDEDDEVAA